MDVNYFRKNIYDGMLFKKATVTSKIINVKKDGFTYEIGNKGNYKKVTYIEVARAIEQIEASGFINRKWYEENFPKKSRSNPCNFTSIGGVLQELGYVIYSNNEYRKDVMWQK